MAFLTRHGRLFDRRQDKINLSSHQLMIFFSDNAIEVALNSWVITRKFYNILLISTN